MHLNILSRLTPYDHKKQKVTRRSESEVYLRLMSKTVWEAHHASVFKVPESGSPPFNTAVPSYIYFLMLCGAPTVKLFFAAS